MSSLHFMDGVQRPTRLGIAAALAVGWALLAGCNTLKSPIGNPFSGWGSAGSRFALGASKPAAETDPFAAARAPKPLVRANSPASTSLASKPVVPTSFEQQTPPSGQLDAGGVSLGKEPADGGKSWWERTSEKFSFDNMKNSALTAVGMGPDQNVAKQKYAEGNERFLAKQYDEAAKAYKEAARRWPDSVMEEDALFMLGESQFFADRYSNASDTYGNLLKKYENSRYLDKIVQRQFAIGRLWDAQGQKVYNYVPNLIDKTRPMFDTRGNAISVYENIRLSDPTGPLADDAIMATANAYFLNGQYEDAAYHYDLLRKDYPKSEHQPQAHLLGLQSRMLSYQGPQYDSKPLVEAEKLADATINQFGQDVPEERARLIDAKNKIRIQQAERDFENGEYYYRRRYYGAARHYYQLVAERYPETAIAQMARKRIDETKDLPPEPRNYFTWLGKVFGERDRSKGVY